MTYDVKYSCSEDVLVRRRRREYIKRGMFGGNGFEDELLAVRN